MTKEIIENVVKFTAERNWNQFHSGMDLALSINLETAELLEIYQWSGLDLDCYKRIDKIKEELADVFLYAILFCDYYNFCIKTIIDDKIVKNSAKYPMSAKLQGESIVERVIEYRSIMKWNIGNHGKNLAIALHVEAAELLELYQWETEDLRSSRKIERISEEIADIMIYSISILDHYDLDIDQILVNKMKLNNEHYPIEKAKNKCKKYYDL